MNKLKKFNSLTKVLISSLIISSSMFLFIGCQNKNNEANVPKNNNSTINAKQNSEEIKKQMEDNIKSLISDGTINQSQGDKILEALSNNNFSGRKNPNNAKKDNQQNGDQNNKQNNKPNNATTPQDKTNNRKNFNPLSKLVEDGVITQAQADTVMQKIRGNFSGPKGN